MLSIVVVPVEMMGVLALDTLSTHKRKVWADVLGRSWVREVGVSGKGEWRRVVHVGLLLSEGMIGDIQANSYVKVSREERYWWGGEDAKGGRCAKGAAIAVSEWMRKRKYTGGLEGLPKVVVGMEKGDGVVVVGGPLEFLLSMEDFGAIQEEDERLCVLAKVGRDVFEGKACERLEIVGDSVRMSKGYVPKWSRGWEYTAPLTGGELVFEKRIGGVRDEILEGGMTVSYGGSTQGVRVLERNSEDWGTLEVLHGGVYGDVLMEGTLVIDADKMGACLGGIGAVMDGFMRAGELVEVERVEQGGLTREWSSEDGLDDDDTVGVCLIRRRATMTCRDGEDEYVVELDLVCDMGEQGDWVWRLTTGGLMLPEGGYGFEGWMLEVHEVLECGVRDLYAVKGRSPQADKWEAWMGAYLRALCARVEGYVWERRAALMLSC